ncbi:ribonuclease H-like protein [Dichomitus squalens]|uniref:RNA exonuclease 4 n=1 Tax=Dichomitus squalens TaxID=114155 RepID=A0A4Q9PBC7_9APHY|nr:ribonuclease H-like protein [Dichomitus squalens LYAD-421 SS1]EJF64761.1 ribonuclease H-like protein [Dichomitus squalens LYAD-421 SS1]TBU50392.1 ribonuclease H-like protein [Dichomitus squalens]TBU62932.1 ribonuclease H-like protein [Dichomitus squalens]
MASEKPSKSAPPSSNWLALQKKIARPKSSDTSPRTSVSAFVARKRRKLSHTPETPSTSTEIRQTTTESHTFPRGASAEADVLLQDTDELKNGESLMQLRRLVIGEVEHPASHQRPGKYLALDCEMVGVGIDGAESSLARVSLVNYYGFVLLDAFVQQRERVVDYRTEFSGIRPSDMVHARPFEDVQKEVADLLQDRILVGHAVHNDLKALLLSHPRPHTRDTQSLAHKHKIWRGRRPALRHLAKQELGLTIQGGEHSSVTDARATMALFRLHRRTWEKNVRPLPLPHHKSSGSATPEPSALRKRPRAESLSQSSDEPGEDSEGREGATDISIAPSQVDKGKAKKKGKTRTVSAESFPGGGRKGVSSGLSTVVKRAGGSAGGRTRVKTKTKEKWWKDLGGGTSGDSKGSVRLKVG